MKTENPVGWFEIYVDDLKRARQFYETVFETELDEMPNPNSQPIQMLGFPGNMEVKARIPGALVKMEGMPAGGNSTIVYFSSADCNLELARVEGAGGKVIQAKMPIGEYGFIALITDTESNMIGIHSLA